MQPSHPAVASVSRPWETEGLSLHDIEMNNTTLEMDLMDDLGAGINEFSAGSSQINTPDISPETLEYVFTETGADGSLVATETFEDVEYSTLLDTELNTANAKDFTENIWGHDTWAVFETPELGLCAPANVVEGTAEEFQPLEAASPSLCQTLDPLEIENMDLLKWIVNDQEISTEIEEPKPKVPLQEAERVSVIVPVVSQQFRIDTLESLEIKTENLSEDEKYRKMRHQNNEASKRCRANRKRKHQETEEELEMLAQRNVVLRTQMDEMEREVRELKSKLLTDITISRNKKL